MILTTGLRKRSDIKNLFFFQSRKLNAMQAKKYDGKNKKKWIIHEKMKKIFRGIKKFQRQMIL